MARKHRSEVLFHSGSFLDVLCNMVGILIILIAVVGMRVANQDDPVVDDDAPEPIIAAVIPPAIPAAAPAIDPAIEQRRKEQADRMAEYQLSLARHEAETAAKQADWQARLAAMDARIQQLKEEADRLRAQVQTEADAVRQDDDKRMKLVAFVASAENQNSELLQSEAQLQKQALELMEQRKVLQEEIEAQKVARAIRKPVFEVIAHDGNSGTNRRPILIECRADGLTFASEKVTITARDLNDSTPDHNPLLAGAEALTTYWTLYDAQHGNKNSKPYVLLIVRPGGTVAFYVAKKFLERMNQEHGYELVPDGVDVKWPPADPQAVEICQSAVDRAVKEPRKLVQKGGAGLGGSPGARGVFSGSRGSPIDRFGDRGGREVSPSAEANQIVGNNGEFHLQEVDQLRNASPKDSIDMLGPEWSPQRRNLGTNRPGAAHEPSSQKGTLEQNAEEYAEQQAASRTSQDAIVETSGQPGQSNQTRQSASADRGMPTIDQSAAAGAREFTDRIAAGNGAGQDTGRSGVSLKPYGDENNPLGVSGQPGMSNPAGAQGNLANSNTRSGQRPELPDFPVQELKSGMPRDGGTDRQWGKAQRSGAIGIEREVIMQLYADRVAIVDGPSATFPEGIDRGEFHQLIASMIQTYSMTWGDPPGNFVWRPRLKFEIYPGGNQHYARLKELMQHWGLSSKVEYKFE